LNWRPRYKLETYVNNFLKETRNEIK